MRNDVTLMNNICTPYNIYKATYYQRIDNGVWFETCFNIFHDDYRLLDVDVESFETILHQDYTWKMFDEVLKTEKINGIERRKTLIAKKPYIRIYDPRGEYHWDYCDDGKHTFSVKVIYTKLNPSVEWLQKHLTADEFIKYFKSRGMMVCPIT